MKLLAVLGTLLGLSVLCLMVYATTAFFGSLSYAERVEKQKLIVTLPNGNTCSGSIKYSSSGRVNFLCDDGSVLVNLTNAKIEKNNN